MVFPHVVNGPQMYFLMLILGLFFTRKWLGRPCKDRNPKGENLLMTRNIFVLIENLPYK